MDCLVETVILEKLLVFAILPNFALTSLKSHKPKKWLKHPEVTEHFVCNLVSILGSPSQSVLLCTLQQEDFRVSGGMHKYPSVC